MDNHDSDAAVQLSPTAGYYIRKLLRQQGVASPVEPTADLNLVLGQHYTDPMVRQAKIATLERLAQYHQVLSSQGSQHQDALQQTEQEILQLLDSPITLLESSTQDVTQDEADATSAVADHAGLILYISDQGATPAPLAALLQQRGYRVQARCRDDVSMTVVHRVMPDVIVIDCKMSEEGIDLCRTLRASQALKLISIVMVSALHSVSDRLKALKLGVTDYLPSPVEPEEMLARLENHIQFQRHCRILEQENQQLQLRLSGSSAEGGQAAQLAKAVLNQNSDYLLFIKADNTITYANSAACEYLGYGDRELLETPMDTLDVGLAPEDWATIWEHLRAHTALNLNSVHITKSGEALEVLLDLQYLQLGGEEFSYIAAKRA